MLFNLKTIAIALATLPSILAAPAPNADADVKIVYTTVTVFGNVEASIPTGIVFDDDATTRSRHFRHHAPSGTTLSTVTRPSAEITTEAESAVEPATSTTSESAEPQQTSSTDGNSIFNSDVHNGIATFYSVGADNCGTSSTDNDLVCAISQQMYNTVANSESISEYCGHSINITYNGKTIQVKVVDSCESCDANHLDLSPAAFNSLADADLGVIDIQWTWA
jgi:hypothetical protein